MDSIGYPRASAAAEQFNDWWRVLWLAWFAEYILLTCWEIYGRLVHVGGVLAVGGWLGIAVHTTLNISNNLPTLALLMCYYVLTTRTVRVTRAGVVKLPLPWHIGAIVVLLLAALEVVTRTNLLMQPRVLSALPAQTAEAYRWVSGIAAGLATALLVGRLDSHFIRLSPLVIPLLYSYAVVQTAWAAFPTSPDAMIVILNMAFVFKLLLFFVMYWLSRSGVLLYYLDRLANVYEYTPVERQRFVGGLHDDAEDGAA